MHGNLPPTSVSITDQTDSDADQTASEWFVSIVRDLYSKDAGLALALATGFEERTCYRYAAGDRKPPGYFLYVLLRSEHGAQWYAALMDGCRAKWWIARQERQRRLCALLREIEGD